MHNIDFTPLYKVALDIADQKTDPVSIYNSMAKLLKELKTNPRNIFNRADWEVLRDIEHAENKAEYIRSSPQVGTAIDNMYTKLKKYQHVQTLDEQSGLSGLTPTKDRAITADYVKELYGEAAGIISSAVDSSTQIYKKIEAILTHIPDSNRAQEAFQKTYRYIYSELNSVLAGLERGKLGYQDMEVKTEKDKPVEQKAPARDDVSWSNMAMKKAAQDSTVEQLRQEVGNWKQLLVDTERKVKDVYEKYFNVANDPKDLGNRIIDKLQHSTVSKGDRDKLWKALSTHLSGVTSDVANKLGRAEIPNEVLDQAMKALKWNLVKLRGDLNISASELNRLSDLHLGEVPESKQDSLKIKRIPFDVFYDKFNNNMQKALDYIDQVSEKINTAMAGISKVIPAVQSISQIPNDLKTQIEQALKKFAEIKTLHVTAAETVNDPTALQQQQSAALAELANQAKVTLNIVTNLQQYLVKIQGQLAYLYRENISDTDKQHLNELLNPVVNFIRYLENYKKVLEKIPTDIEEQQKTFLDKLYDYFNKGKDKAMSASDWIDQNLQETSPLGKTKNWLETV